MTLTDEGTLINGVPKRRQRKIYSDVLGRSVKSEVWDFEGTAPDGVGRKLVSSTVTDYDARDQAKMVREFAGAAPGSGDLSCPTGTCQKTELTYDGYGRLKTKHLPEQDPSTATAWTYNSDDTTHTVTDARGAVTTYGYATNRGLLTSVTHAISGSPTIALNYDYDATRNRVSMSHSVGGVAQDGITYVYDQISRLVSETRHINSLESNSSTLGNYTIGYQYTLSGNLKSVTDPFNSTTNINYDATGRTVDVTGSYGGVNYTYVSNVGYRAWGGVRSIGTGSLAETRAYNRRLQPAQSRYAQYRYDYTYYDDGTLKELIDLDDQVGTPSQVQFHYMSRLYVYDYAGRIAAVQGRTTAANVPAPFVGNYSFDEFGNMKTRSGYYALNPNTSDTATYSNKRRIDSGWNYDADGRLTASADNITASSQAWTYDAAGQSISIAESSSGSTSTNTLKYDGNGELVFESVSSPSGTKSDYLINSTVLRGVLTKLDASGNKDTTYVPANGLAMPLQTKDSNGSPILGALYRDASGLQENGKAIDPFGARVENVQPPDSSQQMANQHVFGPPYSGYGWSSFTDANNFSTGCTMDGVRTACKAALEAINRGLATGVIYYDGSLASIVNTFGIMPMTHRTTTVVGPGNKTYHDANGNAYPAYGTQHSETTVWTEFELVLEPQNTGTPSTPTKTPFEKKLNECTQQLFGVELRSFTASRRGSNGSFTGYGADALSGGSDTEIGVVNEVNSFSGTKLGQLFTHFTGKPSGTLMGITFPPGTSPVGINYADEGFSPYRNFTANDLKNGRAILATQIHELGNSLRYITGVTMAANPKAGISGDTDPGTRLERCVFGGEYDQNGKLHKF